MPKVGVLSRKKFFPKSGDILVDENDKVSWECVRAGVYVDPKTTKEIKFVLLIGRASELGDTPIPKLLENGTLPLPFLADIDTILRPKGDLVVKYAKNDKDNYEEV
jgi:hypothetical protein